MAYLSDKGLFQKLRNPLPGDHALPNNTDKLKQYRDMILPVSAIALVTIVILAPEFLQRQDNALPVKQNHIGTFHQLSLPNNNDIKAHKNLKNNFVYKQDTAEAVLNMARIAGDNMQFEKAFISYNKAAQIYFDGGRFAQAKSVTAKALSLLQNHIRHPFSKELQQDIIAFWGLQAVTDKALGQAGDALYAAQETFNHVRKFHGETHLETAHYYNFLGSFYQNNNDIMNALHCQYAALKIYKYHNYFDTGNYLIKMNNLGEHYRLQKSYDNAEKIISETIHFIENKFGADVPELAVPLNNLGLVKFAKQERTKAEAYLMRAYQISRKYQSAGHDVTGYIASNLERVQKGTSL